LNWKNKKVLVTGAGGFVGRHLAERLLDLGACVKAFDRNNSQNGSEFLETLAKTRGKDIEVIRGDVIDAESIETACKGMAIIFHLAAYVGVPYSYLHPAEVINNNVMGAVNVLISARNNEMEKIVITSTSEVYGTARYIPIDEDHVLQAQSPYSASKIAADKIAESFYHSFNLPVAIIRPFNVYGPGQSMRAIIPTIITQALTSDKIMIGSLTPTRDFTYISDTVEGFIKMAESEKNIGEVINIGSGSEISIGDLAGKIIKMVNKDIEISFDNQRKRPEKSEVNRLFCNNAKARQLIGWFPKVSLDHGLRDTIDWIRQNIHQYNPNQYHL